jgi:hypothetical protein
MLGELVYAMGGCDVYKAKCTAEPYNYQTNRWPIIARMNVSRLEASAATLNSKIYVAVEYSCETCLNSAELYYPQVEQRTLISKMRFRRKDVSCIGYHGNVSAIWGYDGEYCVCTWWKV